VRVAEGEHEFLELAFRQRRVAVEVEGSLERGCASLALVRRRDRFERSSVVEVADLGFVERSLQCAARH
jgi:hypothetical protein